MKLLEYETTGVVIDETAFWLFYITGSFSFYDLLRYFSTFLSFLRQ